MEIGVEEGAFVEVPTADATGMDRRAFGEFVSHRGEMASYAFGWTTGADPHAGHLTIGMGVGNPGGGTFHARVVQHGDGHGLALTDEPFERVPEGGPDLTAAQARVHRPPLHGGDSQCSRERCVEVGNRDGPRDRNRGRLEVRRGNND